MFIFQLSKDLSFINKRQKETTVSGIYFFGKIHVQFKPKICMLNQWLFWKDDVILVDTPGIGGSKDLSQKLKDYLPNALSFIFVIDVSHAGGMQDDKV